MSTGSSVVRDGVRCRGSVHSLAIVLLVQLCSTVTAQQCAYTPDAKGHVSVPNGVTSIGDFAFQFCTQLVSIDIPVSVTSFGFAAFDGCSQLVSINIPSSVTSIGDSVFDGCTSLVSIDIPTSITSIAGALFEGCTSLATINMPNSITAIGADAFYGCTSLTAVSIPNNVTSIGNYAFYGCSSLHTISIPTSVTSIGDQAFFECACAQGLYIGGAQVLNCTNASIGNYSCIAPSGCASTKPGTNSSTSFAECLKGYTSGHGSCNQLYACAKGGDGYPVCAETNTTGMGVSLAECQSTCLSPNEMYLCTPGGVCIVSISGKGLTKENCLSSCKQAPV